MYNSGSEEKDEDPNYRSNVHSGANYRALKEKCITDENTITLQINTDGAQKSHGVVVDGVTYKVRALIISTDTVARPLVRNSTQFNVEFGCDFCLHPGERVPKEKGNVRVYPEPNSCSTFQPRSLEQHNADLNLVKVLNQTIRGIVGPIPFEDLIDFDHVEAYVPEYMHSCCLKFLNFFFTYGLTTNTRMRDGTLVN